VLFNLKKEQGCRRFKLSNFRKKSILFENEHIQVGYISQAVYESIDEFKHFLLLNLFVGNKTEDSIKELQVEYKADANQLLYANPRNIDMTVPPGYQNKQDLMITELYVPYSFMTMNLSYQFNGSPTYTSIVLPNSILKFASYREITLKEFESNWNGAIKLCSNPFKLCKYLPPDSFTKWFPSIETVAPYS
jgi:hypothetical protein